MMLRSSSTPILSSLLSSHSESPNHSHHSEFNSPKHLPRKLFLHQTGPLNHIRPSSYTFNSSPSINADFVSNGSRSNNGFRRVQSEGNLEGLVSASCNSFNEFNDSIPTTKFPHKINCSILQPIPSVSMHGTNSYEDDSEEEEEEERGDIDEVEEHTEVESEDICTENSTVHMMNTGSVNKHMVELENDNTPSKMHLAKGLGVIIGEFNGGSGCHDHETTGGVGGDGGNGANIEEYYQRMMEENPGNPLFLRNYAQFLQQSKDLGRAEEYYSRAILVDPGDGEVLSKYAQLTWQLHRDEDRASTCFQRAVQAAPENSHVLAAYAGFLWETEEETDSDMLHATLPLHDSILTAAAAAKT